MIAIIEWLFGAFVIVCLAMLILAIVGLVVAYMVIEFWEDFIKKKE